MKKSEFNVVDLNLNELNRSSLIKFNDYKFLLKTIGIGTYGTDRVAKLFVMLPNGDKTLVQTICFVRFVTIENFESLCINQDCFIERNTTWEEAIEYSKQFIKTLYGN